MSEKLPTQPAFLTEQDAQLVYWLVEAEQRTDEFCIAQDEDDWTPVLEALRSAWPSMGSQMGDSGV